MLAGCLIACLSACGSSNPGISVDQLPVDPTSATGEYQIASGDLLAISVFEQEKMSGRMRVRSDGRISLPLIDDVEAAGKSPAQLAKELEEKMKAMVLTPKVTVIVEETSPLNVSILGEVRTPGQHVLQRGAGVAQALASAGGLTNFAHKDRIFVNRSGPKPLRIRFSYDELIKGDGGRAAAFKLIPGDVLVVE